MVNASKINVKLNAVKYKMYLSANVFQNKKVEIRTLGAIQILCETLRGVQSVTKYHMGGGGLAKMSQDNFYW
jgi:hypothetical protein